MFVCVWSDKNKSEIYDQELGKSETIFGKLLLCITVLSLLHTHRLYVRIYIYIYIYII